LVLGLVAEDGRLFGGNEGGADEGGVVVDLSIWAYEGGVGGGGAVGGVVSVGGGGMIVLLLIDAGGELLDEGALDE
jgi:hypothetical protein